VRKGLAWLRQRGKDIGIRERGERIVIVETGRKGMEL
jgi:hypothetical protein